jgi:hypothetical protein
VKNCEEIPIEVTSKERSYGCISSKPDEETVKPSLKHYWGVTLDYHVLASHIYFFKTTLIIF